MKGLILAIIYGIIGITALMTSFIGFCTRYMHPIMKVKRA